MVRLFVYQTFPDPMNGRVMTVTDGYLRSIYTAVGPRQYVVVMPLFCSTVASELHFADPAMGQDQALRMILGHYTP
jgi:hypothetical protein